jgi:hypothetical protein
MRFNLTSEPCFKYSHVLLADKGPKKEGWTSFRFCNEVLYVENEKDRFEISTKFIINSLGYYTYRFCRVRPPLLCVDQQAHPLPELFLQPLYVDLDWHELSWRPDAVIIRGQKIPLTKFYWCPRTPETHIPADHQTIGSPLSMQTPVNSI